MRSTESLGAVAHPGVGVASAMTAAVLHMLAVPAVDAGVVTYTPACGPPLHVSHDPQARKVSRATSTTIHALQPPPPRAFAQHESAAAAPQRTDAASAAAGACVCGGAVGPGETGARANTHACNHAASPKTTLREAPLGGSRGGMREHEWRLPVPFSQKPSALHALNVPQSAPKTHGLEHEHTPAPSLQLHCPLPEQGCRGFVVGHA